MEYDKRHSGPALVLGSARCLQGDLHAARDLLPFAAVFCVNEASRILKPDFLVSLHYERMEHFQKYARAAWPCGTWSNHAAVVTERGCVPDQFPAVQFWWPGLWTPAASSAWFGCLVAMAMGFENILLCGAPMNGGGGYYNETEMTPDRIGSNGHSGKAYAKDAQDRLRTIKSEGQAGRVRSMSGFTREIFGGPTWH